MNVLDQLKIVTSCLKSFDAMRSSLITTAIDQGYSEREIGQAAGMSGPAIHQRKKKIAVNVKSNKQTPHPEPEWVEKRRGYWYPQLRWNWLINDNCRVCCGSGTLQHKTSSESSTHGLTESASCTHCAGTGRCSQCTTMDEHTSICEKALDEANMDYP